MFAKLEGCGLYLVEHELSIRADSDAFRFCGILVMCCEDRNVCLHQTFVGSVCCFEGTPGNVHQAGRGVPCAATGDNTILI